MTRRLFIMAVYDPPGKIDATIVDYIKNLGGEGNKSGDVVLTIDNDIPDAALDDLRNLPNVLHVAAARHGEYDFGSYKRGYQWARDNNLLKKYDWIYFVNDSVYCLAAPEPVLDDLESRGAEFLGMATHTGTGKAPHFQSWFLGVSGRVAQMPWFEKFMTSVTHMPSKEDIIMRYEVGFSALMRRHGITAAAFDANCSEDTDVYRHPLKLLNMGAPFIKKTAIPYIHKFNRLMPHVDDMSVLDNIIVNAKRMGMTPIAHLKQTEFQFKLFGIILFNVTCNMAGTTHNINLFGKIRIAQYKTFAPKHG